MNAGLKVNFASENQDEFIDNADVYANHTGDRVCDSARFIHNTCELLFVEEGEAEYEVGERRYVVEPRSVLIIGATDIHTCRILKTPYVRYGLYFIPRYLASLPMIRDYLNVYTTPSAQEALRLRSMPEADFSGLCELIRRISQENNRRLEDSGDMRAALTWEMTLTLRRLLGKQRASSSGSDNYTTMLSVRDFIDTHYAEDLSLKRFSGAFFLHPDTISRNFSGCFGITVSNYITRVRISGAVRLLEQTGESITEIANCVGYNNVNTFIRAFTKVMQTSPLQYRKKHIEIHMKRTHYDIAGGQRQ